MAKLFRQVFEETGGATKLPRQIEFTRETNVGGAMEQDSNIVDLYEDMLSERAARGIRPVLYISSGTDLECSMMVLLGGTEDARFAVPSPASFKRSGYHSVKD